MFLKNKFVNLREKIRKNRKGMTLMELIVVVVIIGILVGLGAKYLPGVVENSKISRAKSDVETLTSALDLYYADTGKSLEGEVSTSGGTICDTLLGNDTNIDGSTGGPWLKACPVPPWSDTKFTVSKDTSLHTVQHIVTIETPNKVTISSKNLATVSSN